MAIWDMFGNTLGTLFIWTVPFLFVLTVVVFFHELGHFMVARWCGVKVDAFSIGFGKELFGFNDRHGTRWRVAAIPLGGYVKFADDGSAASTPDREKLDSMTEEEKKGAFQNKSLPQRAAIVAAGPIANFILAIVIYAFTFTVYGERISKALVDDVVPGAAAAKAGIQKGDEIVAINGRKIESFSDMQRIVTTSAGLPLNFKIRRGERFVNLTITPAHREIKDLLGNKASVGQIGVIRKNTKDSYIHKTYDPLTATWKGVKETGFILERTLTYIGGIFTGRESAKQLGGPIQIAHVSSKFAGFGFMALVQLIALLSISIGLMNLFPIPMLDGGHLLYYAIEAIKGSPLSERQQEAGFRVGMALMLMLMAFVMFNDTARLLGQ